MTLSSPRPIAKRIPTRIPRAAQQTNRRQIMDFECTMLPHTATLTRRVLQTSQLYISMMSATSTVYGIPVGAPNSPSPPTTAM